VRVAFLGLPIAAILLARDGHDVVFAGVLPERGLRRLTRLIGPARVHESPELASGTTVARVLSARPELIVSWFWPRLIPSRVLEVAPAIGVHPSLLPRHRGPDPYFWAIDGADTVTGVTAHIVDSEYDTGPILGQQSVRIDPAWNAWQLAKALDRPSLRLLRETVRAYDARRPPAPIAQDESAATPAPRPTEDELALRWSWPAEKIERRIRAAAPWPGAWTEIGDELVVVVRARATSDWPRTLQPGEAAVRRDGIAVVRAGEGALELLEGRAEDDDTPLSAGDLALIVTRAQAPISNLSQ
jgi:methionyl-tRNA formyltransferase